MPSPYDRENLIINVLNEFAEKLHLANSDLVLLSYEFTADESEQLIAFLIKTSVQKQPVTQAELAAKIATIKPDADGVDFISAALINAFHAEGRFPQLQLA
ncbi:hypothetical protein [Lactiplantibacillus daowaiensis]|uniref:Uncharacterized protein n=1 Tax=Lactiplantibacillus daowaiensis TaxID=2559918 RepID=A0ABW1RYQ7_9LACO|nr:hypothetical protein [Lactiplantibacillus daowaiensis]